MTHIEAGPLKIPLTHSARCFGAWWSPDLSRKLWLTNSIEKARRAFFVRGSGLFHGKLNSLSSMKIVEHCILPCLLYGAESWILDNGLLAKLESFQAKRILCLHKYTANNIARMALQWPSMRARILIIKLKFLHKIIVGDISLSTRTFRSLAVTDVESLLLVRQCSILESTLDSSFTTSILTSPKSVSLSSIKKDILKLNISLLLSDAASHRSQTLVQQITSSQEGSWPKLWDLALERGVFGTTCIQAVLKFLSLHPHSDNACPIPNCAILTPLAPISCLTIPSSLSPPKKSLMPASVVLTQYSSLVDRYIIVLSHSCIFDLHLPSTSCKPRANEMLCYVML